MGKILRVVVVVGICLSFIAFLGCAQKAAVKDESAGEQKAVAQAPAAKPPEAKVEEQKKPAAAAAAYELSNIYFDFDKSLIKKGRKGTFSRNMPRWLKANNARERHRCGQLRREGGRPEYNLALGQRRANAAAKFLVDSGVAKKRIKTVSYGKEKPVDPGHNEEAWAKNRRDEFVINK